MIFRLALPLSVVFVLGCSSGGPTSQTTAPDMSVVACGDVGQPCCHDSRGNPTCNVSFAQCITGGNVQHYFPQLLNTCQVFEDTHCKKGDPSEYLCESFWFPLDQNGYEPERWCGTDGRCHRKLPDCGTTGKSCCDSRGSCYAGLSSACFNETCCQNYDGPCQREKDCCPGFRCLADGLCYDITTPGRVGGPCLTGNTCSDASLTCKNGTCVAGCGFLGVGCCANNMCWGSDCVDGMCCSKDGDRCTAGDGSIDQGDPALCCGRTDGVGVDCIQVGTKDWRCRTKCGSPGEVCCPADVSVYPCAACARCDGTKCVSDSTLNCGGLKPTCQPAYWACSSPSDCCSGMCDRNQGICIVAMCEPDGWSCSAAGECCSGGCPAGLCESVIPPSTGGQSSQGCPADEYQDVAGGTCQTKPSSCANGAIVCGCPEKHHLWCHLDCLFEKGCDDSPNPKYPCP